MTLILIAAVEALTFIGGGLVWYLERRETAETAPQWEARYFGYGTT